MLSQATPAMIVTKNANTETTEMIFICRILPSFEP
jgi:hypothetical protein